MLFNKLPREFDNRDTALVAKELLGAYFITHASGTKQIGKIVGVEAYLGAHDNGVDYAGTWAKKLLRFYIKGNPYVSRK